MLGMTRRLRVWAYTTPVDMRKGFDSLFGLVRVWNLLPQSFVDAKTVSQFQRLLNRTLQVAAVRDVHEWERLFSPHPGSTEMVRMAFLAADSE